MDLRQLSAVVAVAEEGGFTAAAHRLRTGQSTVSTVVRALERDLGTPLFQRTTHRVALTPAGEAFVPAARAALEAVERARAAVETPAAAGTVVLGVRQGILVDLARVLGTLRLAHPLVRVGVRQLDGDELAAAIDQSTVDIALTVQETAFDGLVTRPLLKEELVMVGACVPAPGERTGLSLVDFPTGWAIRSAVDEAFPGRTVSIEVDDLATAIALVRDGVRACVLPASTAERFPDLTARRLDPPLSWRLAVAHRADLSPAAAAVVTHLT